MIELACTVAFIAILPSLYSQQLADTTYSPMIEEVAYKDQQGPEIHIDAGHSNFHTIDNRFKPFANLIEKDGYRAKSFPDKFSRDKLDKVEILVIANALSDQATMPFVTPTQSAFTEAEIKVLDEWVRGGGSLLLIADHMPFAGAAKDLAAAFGFTFYDGFAVDTLNQRPSRFSKSDLSLFENVITQGRNYTEEVEKILTFTGQAFKAPENAEKLMVFSDDHLLLLPDTMWRFNKQTPTLEAEDMLQGALLEYGKGRIAMFGEAAMFTAQLAGPNKYKVGMNSNGAEQNHQFVLNVIHWLDRLI